MVRVAHFSPDASYVDVYMVSLNRKQLFPNVFYKTVSSYWAVSAGPFTYEVRAAGATPESEPVIQVKGDLAAGRSYTVAAVGRRDRLQGLLLRDDMAPSAPGKAKVRFLDAAFDLPTVDIAVAGGPVLESRLAYPEPTGYRQLDSGSYRVEVRRAGAGSVLVKGTVAVKPGTVTSVALLGGAGEPRELYAFSDAAGSRSAPAGGIRTGAGGTALLLPRPGRPGAASPPPSRPRWRSRGRPGGRPGRGAPPRGHGGRPGRGRDRPPSRSAAAPAGSWTPGRGPSRPRLSWPPRGRPDPAAGAGAWRPRPRRLRSRRRPLRERRRPVRRAGGAAAGSRVRGG